MAHDFLAELHAKLDASDLDDLIGELQARLDGMTEEIVAACRARIPSYGAAPEEFVAEVRANTRASFAAGLQILRGTAGLEQIRAAMVEVGRRRASQGIPLAEALLACHVSGQIFWQNVCRVVPEDLDSRTAAIMLGATVVFELIGHALLAVAEGYLQAESERQAGEDFQAQALVEHLAGLRPLSRALTGAAVRAGLGPGQVRWCVVGGSADDHADPAELVRSLRRSGAAPAVGRIGFDVVAFASGAEPPKLALEVAGVAAAADPPLGFRRACAAATVARLLGLERVSYDEVAPLALVLEAPRAERDAFVAAQIGPLLADPLGEELVKTLRAFLRCGMSVARAARALQVHRHTLEYRLGRIEQLLGEDVRAAGRRPFIELALALVD